MNNQTIEKFDMNDYKQKKNNTLPILICILLVLICLGGGTFLFLKYNYTAEKFLDKNASIVSERLKQSFGNYKENISSSSLTDDYISTGNITFSTPNSLFQDFNNINLSYKLEESLAKEYLSFDLVLKQGSANLPITSYFKNNYVYLKSDGITNGLIKYDLEENIFTEAEENIKDYKDILTIENIEYLLEKSVEYSIDALKEADLETKNNLNTVEYIYTINDGNKDKIIAKFKSLTSNDEVFIKFKELFQDYYDDTDITLPDMKLSVTFDILSNSILKGYLETEDSTYTIEKTSKNHYKISEDGQSEYVDIELTNNGFKVLAYEQDNSLMGTIEYSETKNNLHLSSSWSEEMTFVYDLEKLGSNENKIDFTLNNLETDMTIKGNFTLKNSDKTSIDGNLSIDYENETYTFKITSTSEQGTNLVKEVSLNNARLYDSLTENEITDITTKLEEKTKEFAFMSYFENMFTSNFNTNNEDYLMGEY